MKRRRYARHKKFGSHVKQAPEQHIPYPAHPACLRIEDKPSFKDGASEVGEDGEIARHADVGWLDVAVDVSLPREDGERDRDVADDEPGDGDGGILRQRILPFHRVPRVAVPRAGAEPADHATGQRLGADEDVLGAEVVRGRAGGRTVEDLEGDDVTRPQAGADLVNGAGPPVAGSLDHAPRSDVRAGGEERWAHIRLRDARSASPSFRSRAHARSLS